MDRSALTPERVLSDLQEVETLEAVAEEWDASAAADAESLPRFLTPERIREHARWVELAPELELGLVELAMRAAASPALRRLAVHGHFLLFERDQYSRWREWPLLVNALGDQAGMFYLLLALDGVSRLRERNSARGIPEAVTRATCKDYTICTNRFLRHTGRPGMESWMVGWFRLVTSGELHRVGRIQFVLRPFRGRLTAYRQRESGRIVALSEPGVWFTSTGFLDSYGPEPKSDSAWIAELQSGPDWVEGVPLSPGGRADRRRLRLSLREWEPVLRREDPVLEIHIPEGDPYSAEGWRDSFAQALTLFPAAYPEQPFRAFACYSWLLGPELEEMLGPESNLARLLPELYLFPTPSGGRDGFYFIFGSDVDPATAPRDTRLRREVLDRYHAGQPFRGGGMFFLPEDLPRFGSQPYRSNWAASADSRSG